MLVESIEMLNVPLVEIFKSIVIRRNPTYRHILAQRIVIKRTVRIAMGNSYT